MTAPLTMTDAIRAAILYQLNNIHTSFPGIIISYDYTIQKASIQPALNKKYTDGVVEPMPILTNVPIAFPRSGGASISFPVNPGDTVLVICSERSLDSWLYTGGQVTPNDPRKFDLSDGVAIPGLYPFSVPSPAPNNTDAIFQYAGSKIIIDSSGNVKIETDDTVAIGNSSVEVLSILSQTLSAISSITVNTAVPNIAQPINNALTFTGLQTQLDSIKGTIP